MKTKAEVRTFLDGKVGTIVVDESDAKLNGQCVALIKALMELLGVPNPYGARGHAKNAGDAYIAQGIGKSGSGWLTICVDKSNGTATGHIWIDLANEANYESNGKTALRVTKNTRPIQQAEQFVNFDKWISESIIEDMPTLIDEDGVRILAASILQRPEPLTTTPDLKSHIGGDALVKIKEFWYSKEGKEANRLRQKMLKNYPLQAQKIEDLTRQLEEKPKVETKEVQVEVVKTVPVKDITVFNTGEMLRELWVRTLNQFKKK